MPGSSRQESWWTQNQNLHTLLSKFSKSEAIEPRDIIFALLGNSSDACDGGFPSADNLKPLHKVIQERISFILSHGSDDSLCELTDLTLSEFLQKLDVISNAVLVRAAENGYEEMAQLLLATGETEVALKDKNGLMRLCIAAANGHEAMVKLLLATGKVDVDSKDKNSQTALLKVAAGGHEAVVRLLLTTDKVDVVFKDKMVKHHCGLPQQKGTRFGRIRLTNAPTPFMF
jgi:ankyrin repeat protein